MLAALQWKQELRAFLLEPGETLSEERGPDEEYELANSYATWSQEPEDRKSVDELAEHYILWLKNQRET